jgi:hypothetical protein
VVFYPTATLKERFTSIRAKGEGSHIQPAQETGQAAFADDDFTEGLEVDDNALTEEGFDLFDGFEGDDFGTVHFEKGIRVEYFLEVAHRFAQRILFSVGGDQEHVSVHDLKIRNVLQLHRQDMILVKDDEPVLFSAVGGRIHRRQRFFRHNTT